MSLKKFLRQHQAFVKKRLKCQVLHFQGIQWDHSYFFECDFLFSFWFSRKKITVWQSARYPIQKWTDFKNIWFKKWPIVLSLFKTWSCVKFWVRIWFIVEVLIQIWFFNWVLRLSLNDKFRSWGSNRKGRRSGVKSALKVTSFAVEDRRAIFPQTFSENSSKNENCFLRIKISR